MHCRWNAKNGFYVEKLLVVETTNVGDFMSILKEGFKNRKIGAHNLNSDSSRSHTILNIWIITEVSTEEGHFVKRRGKLSFVDLAGSERLKESQSQGNMIKETGNINKSLFTLSNVIMYLSDKKKQDIKPSFRDSKLTMLLQDSLGGNSLAIMIACVSPSHCWIEESVSTLN